MVIDREEARLQIVARSRHFLTGHLTCRVCSDSCPQLLQRLTRYTIFNVSKLTPAGAGGVFNFMSSNASTTRSAITRFRYHFRLAGTIYQGAYSMLVAESTSSNAAM